MKKPLKGRHFLPDTEVIAAALDGQSSDFFEWLSKVITAG
jgi:hypothetical protein